MKVSHVLPAFLIAGSIAAGASAQQQPSSIVLNQPGPHYGDSISYTITYPKEAARKVGRRQMVNPDVVTYCTQNNVTVYNLVTSAATTVQNGDGTLTSETGLITLSGSDWTSSAADCGATLYYFSADKATGGLTYNFLAAASFAVAD